MRQWSFATDLLNIRVNPIACPAKPSGNMPAELKRQPHFILAIPSLPIWLTTMATTPMALGLKASYRQATTAVGQFGVANAFGLFDLHGNVFEWCLDHWHPSYDGAPTDGSAWVTDGNEGRRLLRGGSWFDNPSLCRSAYRRRNARVDSDFNIGFRLVCVSSWALYTS